MNNYHRKKRAVYYMVGYKYIKVVIRDSEKNTSKKEKREQHILNVREHFLQGVSLEYITSVEFNYNLESYCLSLKLLNYYEDYLFDPSLLEHYKSGNNNQNASNSPVWYYCQFISNIIQANKSNFFQFDIIRDTIIRTNSFIENVFFDIGAIHAIYKNNIHDVIFNICDAFSKQYCQVSFIILSAILANNFTMDRYHENDFLQFLLELNKIYVLSKTKNRKQHFAYNKLERILPNVFPNVWMGNGLLWNKKKQMISAHKHKNEGYLIQLFKSINSMQLLFNDTKNIYYKPFDLRFL